MRGGRLGVLIALAIVPALILSASVVSYAPRDARATATPPVAVTATAEPPPAVSASPAPPVPTVQTFGDWKAHQHDRIVMPVAFEVALRQRGWPPAEADAMTRAAEECEAAAYGADGTPIGIDLGAVGDHGETIGPGIHLPDHPGIAQRFDLTTLAGVADAMTEIRADAIRYWGAGGALLPWHCVR